jgi:hypothetical protein
MEIFGTFIGSAIVAAIIAAVIGGFFMWIGAKLANVRRANFGRSIIAAVLAALVTWVVTAIFSYLPVFGNLIGFFLGIVFSIFVIQSVFRIRFGKALIVWLFYIIAQFIAVLLVSFVFGGALIYSIS